MPEVSTGWKKGDRVVLVNERGTVISSKTEAVLVRFDNEPDQPVYVDPDDLSFYAIDEEPTELGGSQEQARKFDGDKSRVDLIPAKALLEVGKVMAFGARKYSEENWRGLETKRLGAAALRHHLQDKSGNAIDEESGLLHKAHQAASTLMELELMLEKRDG